MAVKTRYKTLIVLLVFIGLGVLFFTYFVKVRQIQVGYIGVKSDVSSVNDSTPYQMELVSGYVIYMPAYSDLFEYPTFVQTVNYEPIKTLSSDGITFSMSSTISYQVNEKKANLLYKNYRKSLKELESVDLKNMVSATFSQVVGSFSGDSIVNNRKQFDESIDRILQDRFSKIGLIYKSAATNFDLPASIQRIIDERNKSIENAIIAKDKEQQAQAEADLLYVKENGLRRIDSLRYSVLNKYVVQKMFIDKWDGHLPGGVDVPKPYKDINSDNKEIHEKETNPIH